MDSEQRKFVGTIPQEGAAYGQLLSAVQKAQAVEDSSAFSPRIELALLGVGFYWLVQYDPDARLLVGHSLINRRLEQRGILRVEKGLEDILVTAKPPTKHAERFKPARTGKAQWGGLPFNLFELVEESSLILIGTPVGILRNDYLVPNDPTWQATVYIVLVERYLKDDTKLNLPVIMHHHGGGYLGGGYAIEGDPLLEMGQRYLLFLEPPRGEFAMTPRGRARDAYPGEYIAVHEFTRTPIVDGWTQPAELHPAVYWFQDKKTRLIFKREQQVIQEILAAIKQSRRK